MEPLIKVRDLHFQYDDGTVALDGVNFQLFPGETVAIFGANGSGKTTFVLHLNGLLAGDGDVRVCGMAVERKNLARVLGVFIEDLQEFQLALEKEDRKAIAEFFEKAKQRRDQWSAAGGSSPE